MNSDAYHRQLLSLMQGIKVTSISKSALQNTEIQYPKLLEEQEQIGIFFRNFDYLIILHQCELGKLKNIKKSMLEKIFAERRRKKWFCILYHGSPNKVVRPQYGLGNEKHDYGEGFYLTENIDLAKEWAVYRPNEANGWVHKYELDTSGLKILDFENENILAWLAELMKHRDAAESKRYHMLSKKFIEKYGITTEGYDVIKGFRANASYFYIAKSFVRDEIDVDILEELLALGDLGIQYCIKSQKAYENLKEIDHALLAVGFDEFNEKYNSRDIKARENMRELINSDKNRVTKVFSTLF